MAERNREAITNKVTEIAERVGASQGIEIVDVQMLGGGGARLLRIFIDKIPGSVSTNSPLPISLPMQPPHRPASRSPIASSFRTMSAPFWMSKT